MLNINHIKEQYNCFDPIIQFWGLHNKKIVVEKKKVFKIRVIWFQNLNLPFISWGGPNIYVSISLSMDYR